MCFELFDVIFFLLQLEFVFLMVLFFNNVSSTDSNNKIKLMRYYPKFNSTNLVMYDDVSLSLSLSLLSLSLSLSRSLD